MNNANAYKKFIFFLIKHPIVGLSGKPNFWLSLLLYLGISLLHVMKIILEFSDTFEKSRIKPRDCSSQSIFLMFLCKILLFVSYYIVHYFSELLRQTTGLYVAISSINLICHIPIELYFAYYLFIELLKSHWFSRKMMLSKIVILSFVERWHWTWMRF